MPSVSSLTERVGGKGANAWEIHGHAVTRQEQGEDVIVMSVGDPDFDTPSRIREAAKAAIDAGDTHYVDIRGRQALRQIIAERHTQRTGQPVTPQNVILVPGAQCGLFCSSLCIAESGDELLTTDPVYTTYEAAMTVTGARMRTVRQSVDNGFRTSLPELEAAINPATRAIFIANPNNPTGAVLSRAEVAGIVELASANDLWIVLDEVYSDLVFEGSYVHFAEFEAVHDRLISISSLSKAYAMTGWRLGWMIGPDDFVDHAENLLLGMLYGMPGFIQTAAITALRDCADDSRAMLETYRRRRALVLEMLSTCKTLNCIEPQAGMFLMLDVRETGFASAEFVKQLYRETGVSVMDGGVFGDAGDGFVRLSFACGEKDLAEGCRRILAFINGDRRAAR